MGEQIEWSRVEKGEVTEDPDLAPPHHCGPLVLLDLRCVSADELSIAPVGKSS